MHFQLLCILIVYSRWFKLNNCFIYVSSEQKTKDMTRNKQSMVQENYVIYFPCVLPSIQKWLLKIMCLQLQMQNNSDTHTEMTCRAKMSYTVKG